MRERIGPPAAQQPPEGQKKSVRHSDYSHGNTRHVNEYAPIVAVDVPNKPQPQGSMTSFGRGRMAYPTHVLEHRELVTVMLRDAYRGEPVATAVTVWLIGWLPRPKSHFGTGRNAQKLKPSARQVPVTKPDTDKLCRLVGDALTNAGVVRDDSQIVTWHAHKRYTTQAPWTRIVVDHWTDERGDRDYVA